jgi:hypothetical protein
MKTLIVATVVAVASYFIYANVTTEDHSVLKQDKFGQLWYDGKAELSSFELEQNRYGELHKGTSVLIYVTEDFSKSKQVKLDEPSKAGSDKLPILKLNATKSFLTGIYPYTIINSIFTPIDLSGTVKTSCSVQEWCGHTFMQINKTKEGFKTQQFSYFESEGDKEATLPNALLEDELWTMVRIDPSKIPQGRLNLVRSNQAVRLMHKPCEVISANVVKREHDLGNGQMVAAIDVITDDKKLTIYHDKAFPYAIKGWDETYAEFGGKALTTKARLIKSMRLPYWKLHNNEHSIFRDSLGLKQY